MSDEFVIAIATISIFAVIFNICLIRTNRRVNKINGKLNRIENDFMDHMVVRIDSIHAKVSILESIMTIEEREIREKVSDIMIDEIKRIKKGN